MVHYHQIATRLLFGAGRYGLPGFSDKESVPCSTHGCPTMRSSFSGRTPARQAGLGGFDSLAPHSLNSMSRWRNRHTRWSQKPGPLGYEGSSPSLDTNFMGLICPDGGTGRRGGLKHRDSLRKIEGSTPSPDTMLIVLTFNLSGWRNRHTRRS